MAESVLCTLWLSFPPKRHKVRGKKKISCWNWRKLKKNIGRKKMISQRRWADYKRLPRKTGGRTEWIGYRQEDCRAESKGVFIYTSVTSSNNSMYRHSRLCMRHWHAPELLLGQHVCLESLFWSGFICIQQTYLWPSENLFDWQSVSVCLCTWGRWGRIEYRWRCCPNQ